MAPKNLSEIEESIELLNLADKVRLLQYLAPKIAGEVLISPPRPDQATAGEAWRHYRALGDRLAATSVPDAPSLTEAVSQLRR